MIKVSIFSGFLGAGKTTLIKKLLSEAWADEKVVLIENEFGEIGIDSGFLREAGIEITEMNSGCICCSLVGDFGKALMQVTEQFSPDRIIIEPSGVGKLSDVVAAVEGCGAGLCVVSRVAVVDAVKCRMYERNFGEFYNDQIEAATSIVLSRSQKLSAGKLDACLELLRGHNPDAAVVTTPWDELDAAALLRAIEPEQTLEQQLLHEHEHHHHEHGEDCSCACHHHEHEHHHHEHGEDCSCACHDHEHEHYHHEHGEDCSCACHHHEHEHHHHEHGEDCSCACHDHNHEHHHADEVFASWGFESPRAFSEEELQNALSALDSGSCGTVLRAKGIVPCSDGGRWLHFDYVPGESELRRGGADYTGRLCIIGAELRQDALAELFGADKR